MPFPIAATIAAGATIAASGANAYAQGKTNRKTRQQNQYFFDRNRENALADWNTMTAYNTPAAQMQRFKEAGLNPHLIYGQGTEAAPIRATEGKAMDLPAPQINEQAIGNAIGNYQDARTAQVQNNILQQTLSNAKTQQELMEAQKLETLAKTDSTNTGTNRAKIDLEIDKELKHPQRLADYQKTSTEAEILRMDADQKSKFQTLSQEEQTQRIEYLKQQIKSAGQETQLREFEINLNKQGNTKNDWFFWRKLTDLWENIKKTAKKHRDNQN
jgi:hypothetical protein